MGCNINGLFEKESWWDGGGIGQFDSGRVISLRNHRAG